MNSGLDLNFEDKNNNYKNKKTNFVNKDLNQFKNYKKIFLPDLEDLRKERNNKNEGSILEEQNLKLNKSKNSCYNSNKYLDKENNYNSNNSNILNFSKNHSYCLENENIINKNDNSKNNKKFFNIEDDFDFEEKENKKKKLLTKEDLKKPKENLIISNWLTNKNIPFNNNFYTNKNDMLSDVNNSNIDICPRNMNKSQIYEMKVSNDVIKKNIYLETLNDQEYEGIYDKKNKSFNNIGENISDMSNSNLSAGALSPINKGNSNFYFLNNKDLNLNNDDDETIDDLLNKKKSNQDKFSEDINIREQISKFNNNNIEKTNIPNDTLKNKIHKELNFNSKQVIFDKLDNYNEKFDKKVFKNNNSNLNINNNKNLEKNPIESLRDKIYSKNNSKLKIDDQNMFDEQDELDKVLSKPLNIDKKKKGKNSNIIDYSKNKKSSNENFLPQNDNLKQNSLSQNKNKEEILNDKNLGKYNKRDDSQFNQINSPLLLLETQNLSQDEAHEINKNDQNSLTEKNDIKNIDNKFHIYNANEMTLLYKNNFLINTDKNNEEIYANENNQINPFMKINNENFNNNIFQTRDYDNKMKLSEEINNNHNLFREIEQDLNNPSNLKSSKLTNLKTTPKITMNNENKEFQQFDFDNFSLGGKQLKKSQANDKNDDNYLKDFIENSHDQVINHQSKTYRNKTPYLDENKNINNLGKNIQINTNTKKNEVFTEDLTDDW